MEDDCKNNHIKQWPIHKINGGKWRLSGTGLQTWEGGKCVAKLSEIIAHQSDDYRADGEMRASDWLLNAWIPDGNENMDQKSLVRLCISCFHEEKPHTQGELCVWENSRAWKSCVREPGSRGTGIRSRFSWFLHPEVMRSHTYSFIWKDSLWLLNCF